MRPAPPAGLLRRAALWCGVDALCAEPMDAEGRVYRLGPAREPVRWVLKLRARRREAMVLHALSRTGAALAPRVVGSSLGRRAAGADEPVGVLCTVLAPGNTLAERLAAGDSRPVGAWLAHLAAVRAQPVLGMLGRRTVQRGPHPVEVLRRLERRLSGPLPAGTAAVVHHGLSVAAQSAAAAAEGALVLCHGDFVPENAVIDDGAVVLCDWEAAHAGMAAEDLAAAAAGLFACGYSALAAAVAVRAAAASVVQAPALRFWVTAAGLFALIDAAARLPPAGPGPREWAGFLGVALASG